MIYDIICIKWGNYHYSGKDVNRLYYMIKKNTTLSFKFHCFTEIADEIEPDIIIHPLPVFNKKPNCDWIYKKEAGLCDDQLGGLNGRRVLFFDLDVLITNNIDELFTYPKNDELYIINDWYTKGNKVGQASCYSWVVGSLGHIKDLYDEDPNKYYQQFGTAAQEFLSAQIIKKYGKLNFWPEEWFNSFKYHCLPPWYLRRFVVPKFKNKNVVKMLAFHGHPKIDEAINGCWEEKNLIKKFFYKNIKPATWIKDYF